MRAPSEAAVLFLQGLFFGALVGIGYDLLYPLRRKRNWPADCLFILLTWWLWLCYSFGICRGDIRFGGTAAMGIGACIWHLTLGKVLQRLFFLFWKGMYRLFSLIFLPFKKILEILLHFIKKVFAYREKKGTIEWSNRRHFVKQPEDTPMTQQVPQKKQKLSKRAWVKITLILVIVMTTAALLTTHVLIQKLRAEEPNLLDQALELEQENQNLQDYINNKDTDEGIKDVAENELGMVDPDAIIYDFD